MSVGERQQVGLEPPAAAGTDTELQRCPSVVILNACLRVGLRLFPGLINHEIKTIN